jgi:glycosyltransferase involved in cell wall biosynthesis
MAIDISVITNCHNEGELLSSTIGSLSIAIKNAKRAELKVEWIFVFDNIDEITQSTFQNCAPESVKICNTEFGDPGLARNAGIEASGGKFITLIDGDDLVSPNWLVEAHDLAIKQANDRVIFHPGSYIYFGETNLMRVACNSDNPNLSYTAMFEQIVWLITSFGRREIYLQYPFQQCDLDNGLAYEDTQWYCNTIAAGIRHILVPNTFFCYRVKSKDKSRNEISKAASCIMGPSKLFALPFQR